MKCHKLLYKPYRKTAPYQQFLQKQKQKQQKKKKEYLYQQIIKFRQSRYPLQFLKQLQGNINPFELSLQKLKEVFSQRHPEYSNQLVNESVEHIFNTKCQESEMVKQSAMVIQYGDQYIRNGRKLIKQDFSFDFANFYGNGEQTKLNQSSRPNSNNPQVYFKLLSNTLQKVKQDGHKHKGQQKPASTERNPITTDRVLTNRSRTDSPFKIAQLMKKTQRFNQLLQNQIRKDKQIFQNLQQIQEGTHNDSINYNYQQQQLVYTDRSGKNQFFNNLSQSELHVRQDVLDTGRSQAEELNLLLSSLNFQEQLEGQETKRSTKSQKTVRINREVKQQLYNVKGNLKLDLIRKAVAKLIKQNKMQTNADMSRINRNVNL